MNNTLIGAECKFITLVDKFRLIIVSFFCSLLLISQGMAEQSNVARLISLETKIYLDPYQVYKTLENIKTSIRVDREDELLWFYLRKAQAEYLLYFFEDFEQTVAEGKGLLKSNTFPEITARFLVYSSYIDGNKGNYKRAITDLEKAISLSESDGSLEVLVMAKRQLAFIYMSIGQYESSLNDLEQIMEEAKTLDNDFLKGKIYEVYGALYNYMENYDQSIAVYKKAIEIYRQLQYRSLLVSVYYDLAKSYQENKQYDDALKYYQLYIEESVFSPVDSLVFFGYYGLAMTNAELKQCQQVKSNSQIALTLNGPKDFFAELYKEQAICAGLAGDFDEAYRLLDKTEQIYSLMPELENTEWVLEVIEYKARLFEMSGDITKALDLYKNYYQQSIELAKQNSAQRFEKLKQELKQDKQAIEIDVLKKQSTIQQLKLQQQVQQNRIQKYLMVAAIVVIITVALIVIVRRRKSSLLQQDNDIDELTRIYNRRFTFDFLHSCISQISSERSNLSIILFDIDNFKEINDQHGRSVGDRVINEVADVASSVLRSEGVIGRIGGEEFLVVLNRLSPEECLIVAHRLLSAVHEHHFDFKQSDESVSISIGIANLTANIETAQQLYVQADAALTESKRTGKNKVTQYSTMNHG